MSGDWDSVWVPDGCKSDETARELIYSVVSMTTALCDRFVSSLVMWHRFEDGCGYSAWT